MRLSIQDGEGAFLRGKDGSGLFATLLVTNPVHFLLPFWLDRRPYGAAL
jgi:hypothetical protein